MNYVSFASHVYPRFVRIASHDRLLHLMCIGLRLMLMRQKLQISVSTKKTRQRLPFHLSFLEDMNDLVEFHLLLCNKYTCKLNTKITLKPKGIFGKTSTKMKLLFVWKCFEKVAIRF